MKYPVVFSTKTLKQLKKLDKNVAAALFAWIKKNLDGSKNPRANGNALTTDMAGLWRYRVGNYRIIAEISDGKISVVVLEAGHRCES